MKALIPIAALLLFAGAVAQVPHDHAEPVCVRAETVKGFEGFATPAAGPLAVGKANLVTLREQTVPPPVVSASNPRPFKPGTYWGEARGGLHVTKAGRYRIAVSQKAWLAVQKAGGEVEAVAHMHGPPCSGIAKIVTFDLQPGRYAVILRDGTGPSATVMVSAE